MSKRTPQKFGRLIQNEVEKLIEALQDPDHCMKTMEIWAILAANEHGVREGHRVVGAPAG